MANYYKKQYWNSQQILLVDDISAHNVHCESKKTATFIFTVTLANVGRFLADRTNGRTIATLLRLSVCLSVCLWRYVLWLNGAS